MDLYLPVSIYTISPHLYLDFVYLSWFVFGYFFLGRFVASSHICTHLGTVYAVLDVAAVPSQGCMVPKVIVPTLLPLQLCGHKGTSASSLPTKYGLGVSSERPASNYYQQVGYVGTRHHVS